ncbi:MAG: cytochrome c peroxidase [Mariprofundaceae bacterium]|nr:cytochrome c peroxidase [Mariprofundaceae bacterium]
MLHIPIAALIVVLLMSLSATAGENNPPASVAPLLRPAEASLWLLPAVQYPASDPFSETKKELGRRLFFDPRLSGNPSKTCATCHHPGLGWADGMARAMANQQGLGRHTPSLLNAAYEHAFFWDGRAASLEDAVSQDLLSPGMLSGETARNIVVRIAAISAYRQAFNEAFASEGVSFERITAALATFVRSIISAPSPFDHWLQGDGKAISVSAKRGFALFRGKAECIRCHSGPVFTDSSFHNTGINTVDPGHYEISGKNEDRNAFKTPGLRDIAITPPYMHNGSKKTLSNVIDFYDRGGDTLGSGNQLHALHLTDGEKKDLLAFLFSLSGENRETRVPALPVALNP